MSTVANRRALAVATQKIVKSNALMPEDFAAACSALAQVFTDTYGAPCEIRICLPASAFADSKEQRNRIDPQNF